MASNTEFKLVGVVVAVLLLLVMGFSTAYTVDQGERAVVTRNGEITGTSGPGLHFKAPLIDKATKFDVRSQAYTMSNQKGEGNNAMRDDSIDALSSEGMELHIDATVRFHIEGNNVDGVYENLGTSSEDVVSKIVRPTARSAIRSCASQYKGLQMYSSERESFQKCVNSEIGKTFSNYGLVLEAVQIRSVNLPSSVVKSINEKQAAEKRLEKKNTEIEIEKKEKQRAKIQAQKQAQEIRITGQALRDNPEVLELRRIEALKKGNTVYVPHDSGGPTLTRETGNASA